MSSEKRFRENPQQERNPIYQQCEDFLQKLNSLKEAESEKLIGFVDKIGKDLAKEKKVKMSQLRKVLDAFEKVRSEIRRGKGKVDVREEVQPLKIHLAYAAGRQRKQEQQRDRTGPLDPLQKTLNIAIDRVYDEEDFKKLSQFIEGLIAYHKFHGGEE